MLSVQEKSTVRRRSIFGITVLILWLLSAAFLLGLLLVEDAAAEQPATTLQATMDTVVDPSADRLWASVGTIETKHGVVHRAPRSIAEWNALQAHARALIAGAATLARPGLAVGGDGHSALADASVPGTRTAAQIRADIDRDPARFRRAAQRLGLGGQQAPAAIDAACEACHAAYWYPRGKPLPLPPADRFGAIAHRP